MVCPKNIIPHSKLELRNHFEPTFFRSAVHKDFLRSALTKGRRKNTTQLPKHPKYNGIMNNEFLAMKLKVSKPITSSSINLVYSIILEYFIILRNKTKVFQST